VNGSTSVQDFGGPTAQITMTGTDAALNVFEVAGADASRTHFWQISAPAGSTEVVNISGASVHLSNFSFSLVGGITRDRVLFNLPEATSLGISGISVEGTVLAPHAHIQFDSGQINGNLIGASISGTGQAHATGFDGCLPLP